MVKRLYLFVASLAWQQIFFVNLQTQETLSGCVVRSIECKYAFKDWNQIRQKIEVGDEEMDQALDVILKIMQFEEESEIIEDDGSLTSSARTPNELKLSDNWLLSNKGHLKQHDLSTFRNVFTYFYNQN